MIADSLPHVGWCNSKSKVKQKGFYNHDSNYDFALTGDWLSWVRANDAEIMTMLENQADNLVKAATILAESISDYSTLN